MVLNDKLKGGQYRVPATKLASRNNVLNTINELIDYFNALSRLVEESFDKISEERNRMTENLLVIYEKTKHFEYVIEHFELDVDSHIQERLNDAIENFQNRISLFVKPYQQNLFNHSCLEDQHATGGLDKDGLMDWDRSVNMLSNTLGIRWFGGKLDSRDVVNKLNNVLRVTKLNTNERFNNEKIIQSNLILEIFLYTPKGITWLSLGQNSNFGYSIIVKYNSSPDISMEVLSENYCVAKEYDVNTFDLDMIVNPTLSREDIDGGNVYIKVKTNIPTNTESGREAYFLSSSDKFNDYEARKSIELFGKGLLYKDNKDVAYHHHKDGSIQDIYDKHVPNIDTKDTINPITKENHSFGNDDGSKNFYSKINILNGDINQVVMNPSNNEMLNLMDQVSGYVIANSEGFIDSEAIKEKKFNQKYREGDSSTYTGGEVIVDLTNPLFVGGKKLLPKNENMYAIDNPFSNNKVLPINPMYDRETWSKTIDDQISNDEWFEARNTLGRYIEADVLLTEKVESNSMLYKLFKVDEYNYLILKSDGIYRFNHRDRLSDDYPTVKVSTNNLFTKCFDACRGPDNNIYLATDRGICKMNPTTYIVERTGVVNGQWAKIFLSNDESKVICIRKDFGTTLQGGKISYGESMAVTNNNTVNLFRIAFGDNDEYYLLDDVNIDKELTNTDNALDYDEKRLFQEEFTVIPDKAGDRYFFFRYGHKMLVTDASGDRNLSFKNIKIVTKLANYKLTSAILVDNVIYFTVLDGGNYMYNIVADTVEEVQYNVEKTINNRKVSGKHYLMFKLANLTGDNTDSNIYVKKYRNLTQEEIAAGPVDGATYGHPEAKTQHFLTPDEIAAGPDPDIEYYTAQTTGTNARLLTYVGKITAFDPNVEDYVWVEFADDDLIADVTAVVKAAGAFTLDPKRMLILDEVLEEQPKINCYVTRKMGKLFFVPMSEDNEVLGIEEANGYLYVLTNQDFIYQIDRNFVLHSINRCENAKELSALDQLLVIQNNNIITTQNVTEEVYYDRVDGSELLNGFNRDEVYYSQTVDPHTNEETYNQLEVNVNNFEEVVEYSKMADDLKVGQVNIEGDYYKAVPVMEDVFTPVDRDQMVIAQNFDYWKSNPDTAAVDTTPYVICEDADYILTDVYEEVSKDDLERPETTATYYVKPDPDQEVYNECQDSDFDTVDEPATFQKHSATDIKVDDIANYYIKTSDTEYRPSVESDFDAEKEVYSQVDTTQARDPDTTYYTKAADSEEYVVDSNTTFVDGTVYYVKNNEQGPWFKPGTEYYTVATTVAIKVWKADVTYYVKGTPLKAWKDDLDYFTKSQRIAKYDYVLCDGEDFDVEQTYTELNAGQIGAGPSDGTRYFTRLVEDKTGYYEVVFEDQNNRVLTDGTYYKKNGEEYVELVLADVSDSHEQYNTVESPLDTADRDNVTYYLSDGTGGYTEATDDNFDGTNFKADTVYFTKYTVWTLRPDFTETVYASGDYKETSQTEYVEIDPVSINANAFDKADDEELRFYSMRFHDSGKNVAVVLEKVKTGNTELPNEVQLYEFNSETGVYSKIADVSRSTIVIKFINLGNSKFVLTNSCLYENSTGTWVEVFKDTSFLDIIKTAEMDAYVMCRDKDDSNNLVLVKIEDGAMTTSKIPLYLPTDVDKTFAHVTIDPLVTETRDDGPVPDDYTNGCRQLGIIDPIDPDVIWLNLSSPTDPSKRERRKLTISTKLVETQTTYIPLMNKDIVPSGTLSAYMPKLHRVITNGKYYATVMQGQTSADSVSIVDCKCLFRLDDRTLCYVYVDGFRLALFDPDVSNAGVLKALATVPDGYTVDGMVGFDKFFISNKYVIVGIKFNDGKVLGVPLRKLEDGTWDIMEYTLSGSYAWNYSPDSPYTSFKDKPMAFIDEEDVGTVLFSYDATVLDNITDNTINPFETYTKVAIMDSNSKPVDDTFTNPQLVSTQYIKSGTNLYRIIDNSTLRKVKKNVAENTINIPGSNTSDLFITIEDLNKSSRNYPVMNAYSYAFDDSDPTVEYFTRDISVEFSPDNDYYLKSVRIEFDLEKTYYTRKIKTTVENVYSHAESYTTTDRLTKTFCKSLLKSLGKNYKIVSNEINH